MLDLGLHLRDLGHDVVVVCRDHDPREGHLGLGELDIRAVRIGPGGPVAGATKALRRFWIDTRAVAALVPDAADVVHAHEWPALHAGRLASSRIGSPFVWNRNDHTIFERAYIRGLRPEGELGRAQRALRMAFSAGDLLDARRAAAIVTIDRASRDVAQRAFRRPAVDVPAPPADHFFDPPDRAAARRRLDVAPDTFLVLGVGIMAPHRRFEDLVDALALVPQSHVEALILGSDHASPDYGEAIAARIRERELGARVRLPRESVPEAYVRDAYAAADVFVFPNDRRQSWGLAPLEALAAGTPVILSRAAGVAELLEGVPGVRLVDPYAPDQIAAALQAEVEAPTCAAAQRGREWVRAELGSRRYAERIADIYASVVASSSANRAGR